jgi:RimJ/RimL family protein N-acetyltransferase
MTTLHSERLALVPFSNTDADELFVIRGDAEAMRYWDWPADRTIDETRSVALQMLDDVARGAAEIWTARLASDGAFVGVFDVSEIAGAKGDLGFMVVRAFWGKGYAYEAASRIIAHAWTRGLTRLEARIHAGNNRSLRLLERLGFEAHETRDIEIRDGVMRRCQFFSLRKR